MSKMEKKKSPLEEDPQVQALLKQHEKDEEKKAETATLFDIDDFTADTDQVKSKVVKGIGLIKYKLLTMEDLFEVQKTADSMERGLRILAVMMGKADSKVTYEKVCKLTPSVANQLISALASELDFLTATP